MSMVTVHGPNTMYTGTPGTGGTAGVAFSPGGQAKATQSPANGLVWTFEAVDKSRPAGDYSWAFPPDGTPASPTGPGPQVITYGAAATKIGTLTVAGTNPAPPGIQNGSYAVTVPATAGMPRMVEQSAEPDMSSPALKPEEIPDDEVFDPADYTVDEVVAWAEENPDQLDDLIAAEEAGKNRSTLVHRLQALKG